mgnify:CR=1 FL=1
MSRSVNIAIIIGNLTKDPEMRYTPGGHAVTSFTVATNRNWVSEGQEKEDVEFHNVVAWNKLAELCSQLLSKGKKVYIHGRLQTHNWDDANGLKKYRTEIIAEDMVILDPRKDKDTSEGTSAKDIQSDVVSSSDNLKEEQINAEEIPF